jgi:glycogen debranching enzyme
MRRPTDASGVVLDWAAGADPAELGQREWLVTNGLGGYASGTVFGIPTRRYHGLFVPNLAAPKGRHLLIGRFDEEVRCGDATALIGGAELDDGRLASDSPAALRRFGLDGLVPLWRWAVGAAVIERSIVMPQGRNTVCVHYRLVEGPTVRLHLRPYAVFRRMDAPLVTLTESPLRLTLAPAARDDFARHLVLAADAFLVLPASRSEDSATAQAEGAELRTVIAGYHWFGDWGRDTMIALEGLTLATGRRREAAAILRTFARYVRDGLLPNLFPEGEREARYNTIDATLWLFHALDRYNRAVDDRSLVSELHPVLASILEHHFAGTLFGIGVDPADGLLRGGADGYALTWMDAVFDGWVVTPRRGKPVEIQALWYNALELMAEWTDGLGGAAGRYRAYAARVRRSFNRRFWNPSRNALYDVIDGPDGDDDCLRPNQLFALSLAHPILDAERWPAVLSAVRTQLLTPYGLRTLSPAERGYCPSYHGTLRNRDAAYHQGTVWPWLIGHYLDAAMRAGEDRRAARAALAEFPNHLRMAGVGSISEICDAEPPYRPRGCIAQAWSVAEVLRAWLATEPEAHV